MKNFFIAVGIFFIIISIILAIVVHSVVYELFFNKMSWENTNKSKVKVIKLIKKGEFYNVLVNIPKLGKYIIETADTYPKYSKGEIIKIYKFNELFKISPTVNIKQVFQAGYVQMILVMLYFGIEFLYFFPKFFYDNKFSFKRIKFFFNKLIVFNFVFLLFFYYTFHMIDDAILNYPRGITTGKIINIHSRKSDNGIMYNHDFSYLVNGKTYFKTEKGGGTYKYPINSIKKVYFNTKEPHISLLSFPAHIELFLKSLYYQPFIFFCLFFFIIYFFWVRKIKAESENPA